LYIVVSIPPWQSLWYQVLHVSHSRAMKNHHLLIKLLLSGQVELNPGPRSPRWPCGSCGKNVNWSSKALECEHVQYFVIHFQSVSSSYTQLIWWILWLICSWFSKW
jgi:hypothetical protein